LIISKKGSNRGRGPRKENPTEIIDKSKEEISGRFRRAIRKTKSGEEMRG